MLSENCFIFFHFLFFFLSNSVVALLFVKDLALLDPDDNFTIQTVCGFHEHPLRFVMQDTPLRVMLEEFKKVFLLNK